MRRLALLSASAILLAAAATSAEPVQGRRCVKNGQDLVVVWGTHAERGYAAGALVGAEAVRLFRAYVDELIGWPLYPLLLQMYDGNFTVPPEFETEAPQLLAGARDAGISLWVSELGRELTTLDLALMSSIPDLDALGMNLGPWCSSLSAWDTALADEPDFDGDLVHARNLDWSDTSHHDLAASTLVMVAIPAEADEQPWVALTFPGMWGTLSAMNASGVGVTLNMGNYKTDAVFPCDPVMMTMRTAIEKRDVNGDGTSTVDDLADLVDASSRGSSFILHCFMPPSEAGDDEPDVAVETNSVTLAIRTDSDDPVVSPDVLLATNHHRVAYPPVPCDRYETLQDEVVANRPLTTMEVYDAVRQVSGGAATLQSMILRPDPRDLFISHVDAQGGQTPLVHLTWAELMDPPVPEPVISGPCFIDPGGTAVLDAGPGWASYRWSTGATTQTVEVSPPTSTTYSVTITDSEGWEGNDEFPVRVWDQDTVLVDCFDGGDTSGWSATVS